RASGAAALQFRRQTGHHSSQHRRRMPEHAHSGLRESEILLRATALHRLGIRQAKPHEAFFLEPCQGCIDGSNSDGSIGTRFDLAADRHAIRFVAEMCEREHHVEFEFTDEITLRHVSSTNAYLDVTSDGKVYRRGLKTPPHIL